MAKEKKTEEVKKEGLWKRMSAFQKIIVLLLSFFVLGSLCSSPDETNEPSNETTEAQEESTESVEEVIEEEEPQTQYTEVKLIDFIGEYDNNEISAQNKYTDTYITSSGYVGDISDTLGQIYVIIDPENDDLYFGTSVQCYVSDENAVTDLSSGGKVSFRGLVKDQSLFNIPVKECEIL